MSVKDIIEKRRTISFEVFPPKSDKTFERLCSEGGTLDQLSALKPDFITCTYASGGTNADVNVNVMEAVAKAGRAIPLTHFACGGCLKDDVRVRLQEYLDKGIDHILALRGSQPGEDAPEGSFRHATELISFIRREFGDKFTVAAAGYPEGHAQSRSLEADIAYLRQKQDNGADFIMTQFCWDMDQFRFWSDAIRTAGITLPVIARIYPVTDAASTINMAISRYGCAIPKSLSEIFSKYWITPNPYIPADDQADQKKADFRKAGMDYTFDLIDQYRACDIAGIQIYTVNKPDTAAEICDEMGLTD